MWKYQEQKGVNSLISYICHSWSPAHVKKDQYNGKKHSGKKHSSCRIGNVDTLWPYGEISPAEISDGSDSP